MQEKLLEIHTIQDNNLVKVICIEGQERKDLPPEGGFYVAGIGALFLVRPKKRLAILLQEGNTYPQKVFRQRVEFITEKITELHSRKKQIDIPIEEEKEIFPPELPEITMPKDWPITSKWKVKDPSKRKNTGIQVTISDDPFPVVTHLQALTRRELPAAYLESYLPKVWLCEDKLFSEPNHILLEKGEEKPYSRREIADALLHIKLAGEHLAAVNKSEKLYLKYRQAATFKDGKLV